MFRALLCPSSGASILPAFAASGLPCVIALVVLSAMSFSLLSSEKDIADNTTNATTQGKLEAANAGRIQAPDDGHKSARNM
jgi:hypothetical protein